MLYESKPIDEFEGKSPVPRWVIYFCTILAMILASSISIARQVSESNPRFEVVSIKPNVTASGGTILCHGMDAAMPPGSAPPLGRCQATHRGLVDIIAWAYDVQYLLISGEPDWAKSERFDILAKAEDPTETNRAKFQLMLRSMLADRFRLTFHRETREASGYELVVAKGGAKLVETSGKKVPQGVFVSRNAITGNGQMTLRLAFALGYVLKMPVADETKLAGIYDFELKWVPQPDEPGFSPKTNTLIGPSIFSALQEQLGLRLESKKVPVEFFSIDHAERPTFD
jgi:uncharacterized protein (TIGR03435 family)